MLHMFVYLHVSIVHYFGRRLSLDSSSVTVGNFEVANVTASVAYALGSGAEEGQISVRVVDQRNGRLQLAGASDMSWKLAALESLTTGMSSPNFVSVSTNLSSLRYIDDGVTIWIYIYSHSGSIGLPYSDPSALEYFKTALSQTMAAALARAAGSATSPTANDIRNELQWYSSAIYSSVQIDFDYHDSKIADQITSAFEHMSRDWQYQSRNVYWNYYYSYYRYVYAGNVQLTSGSRMYASACSISSEVSLNLFSQGQQVTFSTGCDLTFVSPTSAETINYDIRVSCSTCSSFSGNVFYSYATSADAFDFLGTLNRTLYEASGGSVAFNANLALLYFYDFYDLTGHNHLAPTLQLATSVSFDRTAYEISLSERAATDLSLTAAGHFGFDFGSVDGHQEG